MQRWILVSLVFAACGGESSPGDVRAEPAAPADDDAAERVTAGDVTAGDVAAENVPADWVRVEARCGYEFQAPPDIMALDSPGIDSCLDAWVTPGCQYSGDYGGFSDNLFGYQQPEYEVTRSSIDGRETRLVKGTMKGQLIAAVSFPELHPETPGVRLTVWARCDDAAGQGDAVRVFETIRIGAPRY